MGKSDKRKAELRQFLQDLNLPRGKVRDWIHRLIERRVPQGAICLALQGKLLADELVGLSQYRLLLSGFTVPFSRLENWLKFWRFPRHFLANLAVRSECRRAIVRDGRTWGRGLFVGHGSPAAAGDAKG